MLTLTVLLSYSVLAIIQTTAIFGKLSAPIPFLRLVAFLCYLGHGALLYKWIETSGGQNLDVVLMVSLTIWLMCLILFITFHDKLARLNMPLNVLALLSVLAYDQTQGSFIIATYTQPMLAFHILVSILSTAFLFLAMFQAVLLMIQYRLLKTQINHVLFRALPAMTDMEQWLFALIWTGMGLLSVSLVTAFLTLDDWLTVAMLPKTLLAMLAWLMFGSILVARHWKGLRGSSATRLTLFAGGLLFLSYFGTKLIFG